MKQLACFTLPLLAFVFISSCVPTPIECFRVSTDSVTETRDIKDFKGIVMYEEATLKISQGPEYVVKLSGPRNVVELTQTTMVNDHLTISSEDCFNGSYELIIEVAAPDFDLISLSTMGTFETNGVVKGDNILIELYGDISGSAAFEMDSVYTAVSGKGILNFFGSAKYHQLALTGESIFNGFQLTTDHTKINLKGMAECEVTANEILEAMMEGSGNVYYKGNPQINSDIIGTGKIINSN